MYSNVLTNYNVEISNSLDEGIAVLYNPMSNQIDSENFTSNQVYFNETERFAPLLYNNLKGEIVKVVEDIDGRFIEVDKLITNFDAKGYGLQLIDDSDNCNTSKSLVRYSVLYSSNADNDDKMYIIFEDVETEIEVMYKRVNNKVLL